jgi:hypothetical protein
MGEDTGIKGTSDIASRDTFSKQEKGLHPLDIDAHWLQVLAGLSFMGSFSSFNIFRGN